MLGRGQLHVGEEGDGVDGRVVGLQVGLEFLGVGDEDGGGVLSSRFGGVLRALGGLRLGWGEEELGL